MIAVHEKVQLRILKNLRWSLNFDMIKGGGGATKKNEKFKIHIIQKSFLLINARLLIPQDRETIQLMKKEDIAMHFIFDFIFCLKNDKN